MIELFFLGLGLYFGCLAIKAYLIEQMRFGQGTDDFEDHSGAI